MNHYIFREMSTFDLLPFPLEPDWILISEFKMTWKLFITIIKFVWQMFLDECFQKELLKMFFCNRNQDIDVVRSVVRKHRVVWRIWQGLWSIQLHEDQSCLDIVISALSKREFMNRLCPFLILAIHFQHSLLPRCENTFPASHHSFNLSSFWDWFVMWHTTHLTRHAHCSWFYSNVLICKIQGFFTEWLSTWGMRCELM